MNKNLYKNGILTLYLSRQPQYTVRQYYASGGIATLVPRKGFFLGGIGDFVGDLVGGVGDAIGGIADFAGDVIDSPIGRIGLTLLAPQLGIPMWAASAGLAAYDFARTGKISPSALVSAGLGLADATGALNFGGDIGMPPSGIDDWSQLGVTPSSAPSGIFSGDVTTVTGIQGIDDLGQVGIRPDYYQSQNLTPTQNYINNPAPIVPNQYENVFTGAEDSTSPLTSGDGSKYIYNPATKTVVDAGTIKPGFFQNLKTIGSFDKNVDLSQRLDALQNVGSQAFKSIYMNKEESINVPAVLATLSLYPNYMAAKQKANDLGVPFDEATYQANKVAPSKERYAMMAPKSSFGITTAATGGRIGFDSGGMSNSRVTQLLQLLQEAQLKGDLDTIEIIKAELYSMKKANGGRIGYEEGKLVIPEGGPGNKKIQEQMMRAAKKAQEEYLKRRAAEELMDKNYNEQSMYDWKVDQKQLFDAANEKEYPPLPVPTKPEGVLSIKLTPTQGKKKGGKIVPRQGHFLGNLIKDSGVVEPFNGPIPSGLVNVNTGEGIFGNLIKQIINQNPQLAQKQPYVPTNRPVNDLYQYYLNKENDEEKRQQIMSKVNPLFGIKKAYGGMINHPVRMLQGGVPELDLRAKGGFIPYGVKERADDVPAMLSKNEFVFTADAVRNAGGGSINKGAQKMYKLMKSLENKKVKKKVA